MYERTLDGGVEIHQVRHVKRIHRSLDSKQLVVMYTDEHEASRAFLHDQVLEVSAKKPKASNYV